MDANNGTMDELFSDFVTKRYEAVPLDELGEKYHGKGLRCWVNPPAYTDQLYKTRQAQAQADGVRSLAFERWIVATFYELDAAKVAEMPDKILAFLAVKADRQYAEYQATIEKK